MGKVNEHSAWGGSAYNSGFGVARSSPERGGVLGAVDCTAFYFKYHLHLHAVPVEGRGADSLNWGSGFSSAAAQHTRTEVQIEDFGFP